MGYQSPDDEALIVGRSSGADLTAGFVLQAVDLVRATRDHADLRSGSSVRGAIDFVLLVTELAALRGVAPLDGGVTLDAAQLALSGGVRVREGSNRLAEDIVEELWRRYFGPVDTDGGGDPAGGDDDPKA